MYAQREVWQREAEERKARADARRRERQRLGLEGPGAGVHLASPPPLSSPIVVDEMEALSLDGSRRRREASAQRVRSPVLDDSRRAYTRHRVRTLNSESEAEDSPTSPRSGRRLVRKRRISGGDRGGSPVADTSVESGRSDGAASPTRQPTAVVGAGVGAGRGAANGGANGDLAGGWTRSQTTMTEYEEEQLLRAAFVRYPPPQGANTNGSPPGSNVSAAGSTVGRYDTSAGPPRSGRLPDDGAITGPTVGVTAQELRSHSPRRPTLSPLPVPDRRHPQGQGQPIPQPQPQPQPPSYPPPSVPQTSAASRGYASSPVVGARPGTISSGGVHAYPTPGTPASTATPPAPTIVTSTVGSGSMTALGVTNLGGSPGYGARGSPSVTNRSRADSDDLDSIIADSENDRPIVHISHRIHEHDALANTIAKLAVKLLVMETVKDTDIDVMRRVALKEKHKGGLERHLCFRAHYRRTVSIYTAMQWSELPLNRAISGCFAVFVGTPGATVPMLALPILSQEWQDNGAMLLTIAEWDESVDRRLGIWKPDAVGSRENVDVAVCYSMPHCNADISLAKRLHVKMYEHKSAFKVYKPLSKEVKELPDEAYMRLLQSEPSSLAGFQLMLRTPTLHVTSASSPGNNTSNAASSFYGSDAGESAVTRRTVQAERYHILGVHEDPTVQVHLQEVAAGRPGTLGVTPGAGAGAVAGPAPPVQSPAMVQPPPPSYPPPPMSPPTSYHTTSIANPY